MEESGARFNAFIQNSRTAFWMVDARTKDLVYTSPSLASIAGSDPPFGTKEWRKIIHPDDHADFMAKIAAFFRGESVSLRYRIIRPSVPIRWIQSYGFPVRNAQGEIYRLAGLLEDVTELEEANIRMHAALAEKEMLLKEIHHRVKNNLQIISSLLHLQTASTADPEVRAVLQESRSRVEVIALLHQQLYQSENIAGIDFSAYLKQLVAKLKGIAQTSPKTLTVVFDAQPVTLDTQSAVLCGLILNELVSNSLRHAFPDRRKGEVIIRVRATSKGMVVMGVRDNGIGLPRNLSLGRVNTLGLKLVQRLTRQLKGTLSISRKGGTELRIKFPLPKMTVHLPDGTTSNW